MQQRKGSRAHVFEFTEHERRIIALRDSGLSLKEICATLGITGVGHKMQVIMEKERLARFAEPKSGEHSSLATARGKVRMEGTR
jgi:hypothetical protein